MSIITKSEICDNVPAPLQPLSFQALIGDMKRIESISNEKMMALEGRLHAAEEEAKSLRRRNEELKCSLAAKERDRKLYYDQYQNIAAQFEEFKAKLSHDVDLPKCTLPGTIEVDIEPAMVVEDTDSEYEENHKETILFTSPDLFLKPVTAENPIFKASSTLPSLDQTETGNQLDKSSLETSRTKKSATGDSSRKKSNAEKTKRSIAKARKRVISGSHTKSETPPKKIPKMLPSPTHFKCRTCPTITFQQIEEYRRHIKNIHPECKFFCDFCPYVSNQSANVSRHIISMHTNVIDHGHKCTLCGVSFTLRSNLGKHIKTFH